MPFHMQFVYELSIQYHSGILTKMCVVIWQFNSWTTITKFYIWMRDIFPREINIYSFFRIKINNPLFWPLIQLI